MELQRNDFTALSEMGRYVTFWNGGAPPAMELIAKPATMRSESAPFNTQRSSALTDACEAHTSIFGEPCNGCTQPLQLAEIPPHDQASVTMCLCDQA